MEWKIINESYLDFLRSYETRIPKIDYGNDMFPIPYKMIKDLDYKTIGGLRTFNDEVSKSKYIDLLKTEIKIINELICLKVLRIYINKNTIFRQIEYHRDVLILKT